MPDAKDGLLCRVRDVCGAGTESVQPERSAVSSGLSGGHMHQNQTPERCGKAPRIRPAADFVEREDGFYLYLDMPGVSREALSVHVEDDELSIQGRSSHGLCNGERVHAMEFGDVEYHAQFALTDNMDTRHVGAQLANGVLTIYIPRREAKEPRRIRIEVI